jgi:hypothetical protein
VGADRARARQAVAGLTGYATIARTSHPFRGAYPVQPSATVPS